MRIHKFLPDRFAELEPWPESRFLAEASKKIASVEKNLPTTEFDLQLILAILARYNPETGTASLPNDSYISQLLQSTTSDSCSMAALFTLKKFFSSPSERFVFSQEFYYELRKTNLIGAKFSDLAEGCGVIKLPFCLKDVYGSPFDEFMYWVGDIQDFKPLQDPSEAGMKMFNLSWYDHHGSWNYTSHYASGPEVPIKEMFKDSIYKDVDGSKRLEEDGYSDHIKSMMNCLLYLKSGDPDLRKMRSDIKYRTPTSTKPVKKDKDLTEKEFTVVGFGYKKSPNYTKDFFYQPAYWARRGAIKKWTWCKGSWKKRKEDPAIQSHPLEKTCAVSKP